MRMNEAIRVGSSRMCNGLAGWPVGVTLVWAFLLVTTPETTYAQCSANEYAKVLAPDPGPGDFFGGPAIFGDTAVVSAPGRDSGAGCAFVYWFDGALWQEVAKLVASDPHRSAHDEFGVVSISGNTIVAGARGDDELGAEAGAAYVFSLTCGAWGVPVAGGSPPTSAEHAKLTAPDGEASDSFGISTAVDGDTIVIGASGDDGYSGSAYVFTFDGTAWNQVAKLVASDRTPGHDFFGMSVAISGSTIVVGAEQEGVGRFGAAYVFSFDGTSWGEPVAGSSLCTFTERAKLTASDRDVYDRFGLDVAISGDTIAVGSYWDDDGGLNSGSAYVFSFDDTTWGVPVAGSSPPTFTEHAKLLASDAAAHDSLGNAVEVGEDGTVVVGTHAPRTLTSNPGAAYVYQQPMNGWASCTSPILQDARLTASDRASSDQFGQVMSINGGVLMVSAAMKDNFKGATYVFHGLSDCNANGTLDICDIADGTSPDLDGNGIPDECDNQPPIITCNGPVSLWPPNHRLVDVSSAFTAWDPDGGDVTLTVRVFSDEPEGPEDGDDTGDHAPDFKDEYPEGRGLLVRAERHGEEDGRFYIFVVTASDGNSETTVVCAAAVVPHDQKPSSRNGVIAQAEAAQAIIQGAVDNGDSLPPTGFYEHGLSEPIGPKQ